MAGRIFLVDDHPLWIRSLRVLITEAPDLEACGEAADVLTALHAVRSLKPDLVVSGLGLRDMTTLGLIRVLKVDLPETVLLVLSSRAETTYVERALRAGAMGYVLKAEPEEVIERALRRVLGGGLFVSPRLGRMLLRGPEDTHAGLPLHRLTDRELEVFELFARGMDPRAVADLLLMSPEAAARCQRGLEKKLGLADETELARCALAWKQRVS